MMCHEIYVLLVFIAAFRGRSDVGRPSLLFFTSVAGMFGI